MQPPRSPPRIRRVPAPNPAPDAPASGTQAEALLSGSSRGAVSFARIGATDCDASLSPPAATCRTSRSWAITKRRSRRAQREVVAAVDDCCSCRVAAQGLKDAACVGFALRHALPSRRTGVPDGVGGRSTPWARMKVETVVRDEMLHLPIAGHTPPWRPASSDAGRTASTGRSILRRNGVTACPRTACAHRPRRPGRGLTRARAAVIGRRRERLGGDPGDRSMSSMGRRVSEPSDVSRRHPADRAGLPPTTARARRR
jgi:hypothetical protein